MGADMEAGKVEDKGVGVGMDVGEEVDTALGAGMGVDTEAGMAAGMVLEEGNKGQVVDMEDDEEGMEKGKVEETAGETDRRQFLLRCNSLQHSELLLQPGHSGIGSRHQNNFQLRKLAHCFHLH